MSYPRFLMARSFKIMDRNTGSIPTLTSTTWANLDTSADIALEARVGDECFIGVNGAWDADGNQGYLAAGTWNGSAFNSFWGSGEPTTTTGMGVPGWFGGQAVNNFSPIGPFSAKVLAAGDVPGGIVTVRWRYRVSATKILYNSALIPLQLQAWVVGPPDS